MMRLYLSIILLSILIFKETNSQQIADFSYRSCVNSAERSLYSSLAQGKVVVVSAAGIGCTTCASEADEIDQTALNVNPNEIEMWGAVNRLLGTADCDDIKQEWLDVHGWEGLFVFQDTQKLWASGSYPKHWVINPADSQILYQGNNFVQAMDTARKYADKQSSVPKVKTPWPVLDIFPNPFREVISLDLNILAGDLTLQLTDVLGNTILSRQYDYFQDGRLKLDLSSYGLSSGYYLLQLQSGNETRTYRLLKQG